MYLPLSFPTNNSNDWALRQISNRSAGILLYGPSGCGKTYASQILLKQILGRSVNIVSVKGWAKMLRFRAASNQMNRPRLFSKYIGDTELSIRNLFATARKLSPSVIFIDELDAVGAKRTEESQSSGVQDRALSTLLNEIDGIEGLICHTF